MRRTLLSIGLLMVNALLLSACSLIANPRDLYELCEDDAIARVSAGRDHTCALRACGLVECWGENSSGQLGDGSEAASSTPVLVEGITDAVAISAADRFTCALTRSAEIWCWGANDRGQLGDGTLSRSSVPVRVSGVEGATALSDGSASHTCAAIDEGRQIRCWGANDAGQLGDGSRTETREPVAVEELPNGVWTEIAAGLDGTCAIADEQLYCWGGDRAGVEHLDTLTQLLGVSAGGGHFCAVAEVSSDLYCWGSNTRGQLGDGTTEASTAPVLSFEADPLAELSLGAEHTCVLDRDESVRCLGANDEGQLGNGDETDAASLVFPSWSSETPQLVNLSAGARHTCVTTGREVWCWGSNDSGQLGDGTREDRSTPTSTRIGF